MVETHYHLDEFIMSPNLEAATTITTTTNASQMGCHVATRGHVACPRPKPLIWQVDTLPLTIKWREAITAR